MALILHIDTSGDTASICLAGNGVEQQLAVNNEQRDHAAWLHPAIKEILAAAHCSMQELDAIAVAAGPGSYTGLRVGLSAAKGICFALNIPLIAINTLQMMAASVTAMEARFYCPAIDARRMEIFTAVYNKQLEETMAPVAMIVEPESFNQLLAAGSVVFTGSGSKKIADTIRHVNAIFSAKQATAADMQLIAQQKFIQKDFADLAYSEPFYLKEFFNRLH